MTTAAADHVDPAHRALFEAHRGLPLIAINGQRLTGRSVGLETADLLSIGDKALWDCCLRFDENVGVKFSTYARQRVLGAMRDAVRAARGRLIVRPTLRRLAVDPSVAAIEAEDSRVGERRKMRVYGEVRTVVRTSCAHCGALFWATLKGKRSKAHCSPYCAGRRVAKARRRICTVCGKSFGVGTGKARKRVRCERCFVRDDRVKRCPCCKQTLGRTARAHEPCVMGWRQGDKPEHDGVHDHDSVWEVDWEGKQRVVGNEHPTQKPIELFARPMRKHTRRGDVVLEPFSGSGSQLIAAEAEGRRCRSIEISPPFVDVAVRRWEKATGREALLEQDGRTFAAVAAERAAKVE